MYSVTLRALAHDALRRALQHAQHHMAPASAASSDAGHAAVHAVDATAGNGHDTLFLAEAVGEGGQVWAFDVQEAALAATRQRLAKHGLSHRVRLILDGHQHLARHMPPALSLHGAMFNLGYLPGAEHDTVTRPQSTLDALQSLLLRMASGSVISVHIYTGHAGGEEECAALLPWAASLPHPQWQSIHICTSNKTQRAEHLLLLSRQ